jgi:glutamate transport system permease protein
MVFVAPQLGVKLPFETSAYVALSLYTAAFVCEAVRSGVNSIGVGQAEAARAIGLTFTQTMSQVVLPQALRTVVPPLINIFIALTKNTSVAVGFFVTELMAVGVRLANRNPAEVIAVLVGVAFFYLAITIPAGVLAGRLERKVAFAR